MIIDALLMAAIFLYGVRVICGIWKSKKKKGSNCEGCPHSGMCH